MKELRRQNAYINNLGLRETDGHIINVRVLEPETQEDMSYSARPTRPGQFPLRRLRRSKKIQVQFMIRELYDLARRTDIMDAANGWAQDGALEISSRPNQMAQVIVSKYASAGDIRDYNGNYTIEFDAAGVPYWQDKTPAGLTLSGTAASGWIAVGGNADTVMDVAIKPTGGTLTEATVALFESGDSDPTFFISLAGLSVASGGTVSLSHDAYGLLRIEADGASILGKRTSASSDELILRPGRTIVSVSANVACDMRFTARGWYR